jgi:hypothetical protein
MTQRSLTTTALLVIALATASPLAAQLSADWMVAAAAHTAGVRGTFWSTDLSLHNPHEYELPVIVQVLPSDSVNYDVVTWSLTLLPWETVNLWDALGPQGLAVNGTAALLAYADPGLACDPIEDCHLLVTSRTWTPAPGTSLGEFGLTVPGIGAERGGSWSTLSYAAGILNDGDAFRCNVGVASWSDGWTSVRMDVQDSLGNIIASEVFEVPPFGHTQRRLDTAVTGGSLVFYLESGPDTALIFPYATVINQETGDASFFYAEASPVGVTIAKRVDGRMQRPATPAPASALREPSPADRAPARPRR